MSRHHKRRRRNAELAREGPIGDERRVTDARRLAREKARLVRGVLEFGVTVGVLSLFLPAVAWIVGIVWGLGLAGDLIKKIIEPELRRRWVAREVRRELGPQMRRQRRVIEDESAKRLEELSAQVAHEIRNPITAAKSLVQQMGEDPSSAENVDYAQVALEELDRVEKSISHLLRFAREEDVSVADVRMADVVESAGEASRDRIEKQGVDVRVRIDGPGEMRGDAEQLRRVLINLLGNALDALAEAGVEKPRVDVEAGENLAGNEVWVRVRDNGPGIEPDRLERIWSPFYTSKAAGTGLGLAVSKKVIDAHGGDVEVHSDVGQGAEFVLTFPKQRPEAPA